MNSINPLDYLICFARPLGIDKPSAWIEHVPFGMFMVDLLRPNVLVELGTHTGVSYSAFCQAVKQLGLQTRCYAVDTWEGDVHAGYYGAEVLADLRAYHDPLYGEFSRLVQNTFDNAVEYFADGSIDLLHIDGLHTYEAVRHDFETWLPRLSERGVVLFHDTNVRERDFGVWKLWLELKQQFPCFEFVHGHGLGVLRVGNVPTPALEPLFSMTDDQSKRIKELFFTLGSQCSAAGKHESHVQALTAELAERDKHVATLQQAVGEHDKHVAMLQQAVAERDKHVATLKQAVAERDKHVATLKQAVAERDGQIAKLCHAVAEQERKIARLNKAVAERDQSRRKLQAIRRSTSWRLTAPLRFIKRSSLHVRRRLRKAAGITARSLYRVLPLSVGQKVRLKGWVFSAFPIVFGHTRVYRNWLVSRGHRSGPGALVSDKPRIGPRPQAADLRYVLAQVRTDALRASATPVSPTGMGSEVGNASGAYSRRIGRALWHRTNRHSSAPTGERAAQANVPLTPQKEISHPFPTPSAQSRVRAVGSAASTPRRKVAFICQPEYFQSLYESDLDDVFDVGRFPFTFSGRPSDFKDVVRFNADVNIFFRGEFVPLEVLERLSGKKVNWSSEPFPKLLSGRFHFTKDSLSRLKTFIPVLDRGFDYIFHYDEASRQFLEQHGIYLSGYVPFPVATDFYRPINEFPQYETFFIGRSTPHREAILGPLKRDTRCLHIAHGVYGEELIRYINASRVVLNLHAEEEMSWEPRLQLLLSCMRLVISEPISPNPFLQPGRDFIEARGPHQFYTVCLDALANPAKYESIQHAGYNHTFEHLSAKVLIPRFVNDILDGRFRRPAFNPAVFNLSLLELAAKYNGFDHLLGQYAIRDA